MITIIFKLKVTNLQAIAKEVVTKSTVNNSMHLSLATTATALDTSDVVEVRFGAQISTSYNLCLCCAIQADLFPLNDKSEDIYAGEYELLRRMKIEEQKDAYYALAERLANLQQNTLLAIAPQSRTRSSPMQSLQSPLKHDQQPPRPRPQQWSQQKQPHQQRSPASGVRHTQEQILSDVESLEELGDISQCMFCFLI